MSSSHTDSPSHSTGHSRQSSTDQKPSIIRRFLSPFSAAALATLPQVKRPARYVRADDIPETQPDADGRTPTVRDYHAINSIPPQVRVPKKISTPVKVEGKVWFANERTWIAWLNISIILATLSLALFNASKDEIARNFAIVYAIISVLVLVYGYALYQHRITMIRRRDPGHFDAIAGPVVLSIILFFAILANFIIRVRELQRKEIPIPGADLLNFFYSAKNVINTTVASQTYGSQGQL
ncbi:hypothetical protein BDQ12DRAFT_686290 [Crucibulum laeve]|uniref:DUF202 domain-containing protein n=1 Tax=Crucibulum laeve TaxID=68775 RepID=A0A5C3LXM8_9AGAR|nr:hypothetical protein BDQ12DRAFT_686290 [Crucibulum laeve]